MKKFSGIVVSVLVACAALLPHFLWVGQRNSATDKEPKENQSPSVFGCSSTLGISGAIGGIALLCGTVLLRKRKNNRGILKIKIKKRKFISEKKLLCRLSVFFRKVLQKGRKDIAGKENCHNCNFDGLLLTQKSA